MLGDPSVRIVDVYVPAGHDGQGLPLLVDLVGFTSSGLSHTNWVGFRENVPERLDRLIGEQRMSPVVVAFPDCFTRLGGNQYINSASMGPWEDFLLYEMLPAIEQRFGCGGIGRRGVFGKSSGGYGAVTHALRHSDIWSAAACHSGELVAARPCRCGRNPGEQSPPAEGALHRLRREGSVQSALRRPPVCAAAERARHCASLRGVPRQPYRRRLPDGREPAFPRPRPVGLMSVKALASGDASLTVEERRLPHALVRGSPQPGQVVDSAKV